MAEKTKEDRKLVKARFFEIDKANTNLSYNCVEVLELRLQSSVVSVSQLKV